MQKKPRVLIVSTTFPRWENDSGPAPFVLELAFHLQRYFSVTVLAPHFPGSARHEVWNGLEIFRFKYLPEKWEFLSDGQGLQNHLRQKKLAGLALIPFLLAEFFAGFRLLRSRRFEAVNSHWLVPSGLLFAILSRIFRVNHFITVHAADYFLLLRIPLGKFIIKQLAKWSKAMIAVNQKMADGIKSIWTQARVLVMPMGFDPEKFQKRESAELEKIRAELGFEARPTLLFVGKLTEKKGVKNLIEAMKLLAPEFPKLQLLIAGEGALRPELEQQSRALGLETEVKFLGALPHQKVTLLYQLANTVVVPSLPDRFGESEGMPVVILEGLASAKPVIGTRYCCVPEDLKKGGFLEIADSDAQAIAEAVKKVLQSDFKADFGIVNKYRWSEVARFYAEVMQS